MASASSSTCKWQYDVFLSFRGEDTRNNFTAHLYHALRRKGINTFIDDDKLKRGQLISPALVAAIESSLFSVVVLSQNYASSRWCLDELVKIVECTKSRRQRVYPIFYDVDPSDVRKQKGTFGAALAKHEENLENMEKVESWKDALTQVAYLVGWDSRNKNEAELIEEFASFILNQKINMASSSDGAGDLVGMDSRICEMKPLLCLEAAGVRIIGIWGMSGIGKKTLARAIFDRFHDQFEGCAFFEDVGKQLEREGVEGMKEKLLSRILGIKNLNSTGCISVKTALCFKKVLVVLDNVKDSMIIEKLAKSRDWFGGGSRIIITTTNKDILRIHEVDAMYEVKKLDSDESMKLFSLCVFKQDHPIKDFVELSQGMVACTHGLPLAIKILGRLLIGKSKYEWETKLNTVLMRDLKLGIQEVLQISYNELKDDEQRLFLDIACFFKGEDIDYVTKTLDSRNYPAIDGVNTLINKSLITISGKKIQMHDLLQEMGREVVCQKFKESGKWTRLWKADDISQVLKKNTGNEEVESISLDSSQLKEPLHFTAAAFEGMNKLRLLRVYNSDAIPRKLEVVHFSQYFKFPSAELRYLFLHGYNLSSLPNDFNAENLARLSMPYSHCKQLWKGRKDMVNLKSIDLSHSEHLTVTPNFSGLVNLEQLVLQGCTSLLYVDPSIGVLQSLRLLNFRDCKRLNSLPESTCDLKSLETFILSDCLNVKKLPEAIGNLLMLNELYLDQTGVRNLPSSVKFLRNLQTLSVARGKRSSPSPSVAGSILPNESGLSSLLKLNLSDRYISDGASLSGIGFCSSLEILILNGNDFVTLPAGCISQLSRLRWIELKNCQRLQALPELPSSIEYIGAHNCTALEAVSNQSLYSSLMIAKLKDHPRQTSQLEPDCKWQPFAAFTVVVPRSKIPDWICYKKSGRAITVELPPNWFNTCFLAFASCVVTCNSVLPYTDSINGVCTKCTLFYSTSSCITSSSYDVFPRRCTEGKMESDHVWLSYVRFPISINWHEVTQIKFSFKMIIEPRKGIKECGVGLVYSTDEDDQSCNINPDGEPSGNGCSELVVGAESHDSDSEYYTADEGEPCVGTACSEDHLELGIRPQKRLKLM